MFLLNTETMLTIAFVWEGCEKNTLVRLGHKLITLLTPVKIMYVTNYDPLRLHIYLYVLHCPTSLGLYLHTLYFLFNIYITIFHIFANFHP